MDILCIDRTLTVVTERVHVAAYDFSFELFFSCSHPTYFPELETCVLRIGAIEDYEEKVDELRSLGLVVLNSAAEHLRASELSEWYPLIAELTPRTICQANFPTAEEVERLLGWPVFVKGSRQTSRHNAKLSIARNAIEYNELPRLYAADTILHWQKVAVREFLHLEALPGEVPGKVRPSLEFRTFWWKGRCVGYGRYWYQLPKYEAADIDDGLTLAEEVARRLQVPFLVVDIAKTADGHWVVIECNDAQESGYAGAVPQLVWQSILEVERRA